MKEKLKTSGITSDIVFLFLSLSGSVLFLKSITFLLIYKQRKNIQNMYLKVNYL